MFGSPSRWPQTLVLTKGAQRAHLSKNVCDTTKVHQLSTRETHTHIQTKQTESSILGCVYMDDLRGDFGSPWETDQFLKNLPSPLGLRGASRLPPPDNTNHFPSPAWEMGKIEAISHLPNGCPPPVYKGLLTVM